jgi:transcription elongation factor Elf1
MEYCPRCNHKTMYKSKVLNPISRRDGRTMICPDCGKAEAMIDHGQMPVDDNERNFLRKLGKGVE